MSSHFLNLALRLRFSVALFAMLAAMWASIDLHQHQTGLHQANPCLVCALEKATAHGFTLDAGLLPTGMEHLFSPILWHRIKASNACHLALSIRAPPSLL